MHHQMLARYNVERFANYLPLTKDLSLDEPIEEGYFPKITQTATKRSYPGRPALTQLRDMVQEDNNVVYLSEMKRWLNRLYNAVESGFVYDVRSHICMQLGY
jgi:tyrosinase